MRIHLKAAFKAVDLVFVVCMYIVAYQLSQDCHTRKRKSYWIISSSLFQNLIIINFVEVFFVILVEIIIWVIIEIIISEIIYIVIIDTINIVFLKIIPI